MNKLQMLLVLSVVFFAAQGQVRAEESLNTAVTPAIESAEVITEEAAAEGGEAVEEGKEEVKKLEEVQL